MFRKLCPVCGQRTANPFTALIWPRCNVCRAKFRVRLPLGLGFAADFLGLIVLLGSIALGFVRRDESLFTIGLAVFVALKVGAFAAGRLEPDARDPVTVMQQRRYGGRDKLGKPL